MGVEIQMKVAIVMLEPQSQMPVVVLKEENGEKYLPIWIGFSEANAIAIEIDGIKSERPLTHDLLRNIITKMGGELKKVVICDLKNSTYFANLHIQQNGAEHILDCRPSDAIAIALRLKAPIYVDDIVFDKTRSSEFIKGIPVSEELDRKIKTVLETLSEEDFGKYKM